MRKKFIPVLLFSVFSLWALMPHAIVRGEIPGTGCFKDFNNNGALDAGEYGECTATPQGYLCLLDNMPCSLTETSANCPNPGSLNATTDQCEYPIQYNCPATGSVFQTDDACNGNCDPSGSCEVFCPPNMTIQGETCVADPSCAVGSYDPAANACTRDVCPYGDAFTCHEMNGNTYCSALPCMNSDEILTELGSPEGLDDMYDDGPRNEDNYCIGQIYIFSGNDRRCRYWGATIAYDNCCSSEDYLLGLAKCKAAELELAKLKGEGLCHYVGQYCSKKIDLGFTDICVEKSKTYCCFNSKLARIVQEQGRAQLSTFDGWGSSKRPICRGLTPEEFQMLDFSLIDLSEWHGDIQTQSQAQIENNLQQGVEDFYNQIGN